MCRLAEIENSSYNNIQVLAALRVREKFLEDEIELRESLLRQKNYLEATVRECETGRETIVDERGTDSVTTVEECDADRETTDECNTNWETIINERETGRNTADKEYETVKDRQLRDRCLIVMKLCKKDAF